jgi:uncharacterized repeat protein (TIGR03843 family)
VSELTEALQNGELQVLGRLSEASNITLLCEVAVGADTRRCVYKPVAGERPLWDFPGAVLAGREVLTARVADAFGWDLVPETVWREDGPAGPGMCQIWVEPGEGPPPIALVPPHSVPTQWREVARGHTEDGSVVVLAHETSEDLQRLAVLDALVNNGDRKGGHVLRRPDGGVAAIDHGVTFHVEPKLRTVLWGWAGEPIPGWLRSELARGADRSFGALLHTGPANLADEEIRATEQRLAELLDGGLFPTPGGDWPALPWPPF